MSATLISHTFPTAPPTQRFSRLPGCTRHRIVQQVKEGFGCPLAVMRKGHILRAVYGYGDFLFLRCIHDPTHGLCHSIKEASRFLIQLDHARFQPGGFHKSLKEKVQLVRLATDSPNKVRCAPPRSWAFPAGCPSPFSDCLPAFLPDGKYPIQGSVTPAVLHLPCDGSPA